ncbi:MAG: hypothetical protein ACYDER_28735 [Ktedonobacteraceae bacterium]
MQSSQILQEKLFPFETLSPIAEEQNADIYAFEIDARQLYLHGMEDIRGKICRVSEGQDRVVMSQLWELGKKSQVSATGGAINRAPTRFPALVLHGFIVEPMVDGHAAWEPCSQYLKDFWQVGIQVSNGHGFLLLPEHVFYANMQAALQMNL